MYFKMAKICHKKNRLFVFVLNVFPLLKSIICKYLFNWNMLEKSNSNDGYIPDRLVGNNFI